MLLCLLLPAVSCGTEDGPKSLSVKSALLFKFSKFVKWPAVAFPSPLTPVTICLTGSQSQLIEPVLEKMVRDRTSQGRSLRVRRLEGGDNGRDCQMLYFAGEITPSGRDLLEGVSGHPVFVVSDSRDLLQGGGMLAFVIENERLAFHINIDRVESVGLGVESTLLQFARVVRQKGAP